MGCSVSSFSLTMILSSSCQLPADPCLIPVGNFFSFSFFFFLLQCARQSLADPVKGRLYRLAHGGKMAPTSFPMLA